jgi:glycolate oxidase iron-sulfur subunit
MRQPSSSGCIKKTGLQLLLRKTGLLRLCKLDRAESLMPEADISKLAERYPTDKQHRGNVALFTGCISDHFDLKTLRASIKLLNYIGFDVLIPKQQTCCGAIHKHQGNNAVAVKMAMLNTGVFNSLDVEAIIYIASGCGLMLKEYEQDNGGDASDLKKFGIFELPNSSSSKSIVLNASPVSDKNSKPADYFYPPITASG